MAWPIPGVGIDDPEALYCPIFSAHAYLLGKKEHLMIVPRFENDPIKLAEPAFRKIYLETTPLQLPDGSPMPVAHELWIRLVSQFWPCHRCHQLDNVTDLETVSKSRQTTPSHCPCCYLGSVRSRFSNFDGFATFLTLFHFSFALAKTKGMVIPPSADHRLNLSQGL